VENDILRQDGATLSIQDRIVVADIIITLSKAREANEEGS